MAGRHSKKSSKAPVIIICVVAVAVIAVVCVAIFFFTGKNEKDSEATTQATTSTQTETTTYTQSAQTNTESGNSQTQSETAKPQTADTTAQNVVVPTKSGDDVSYFNATFVPYKAVDTVTGNECSLKEVFGSSYTEGVITFNSDGTFTDSMGASSVNSGAYALEGDTIIATYTNDKNMSVKVNGWEDGAPSELIIDYGGYDVYFNS